LFRVSVLTYKNDPLMFDRDRFGARLALVCGGDIPVEKIRLTSSAAFTF
jgi:hypothetical protein